MEEESCRRNHGAGILKGESFSTNLEPAYHDPTFLLSQSRIMQTLRSKVSHRAKLDTVNSVIRSERRLISMASRESFPWHCFRCTI